MDGGNGKHPPRPYRRVSADEMENIKAFIWAGLQARKLMTCASTFRVVDGEAFHTGMTWAHMQLGIDLGQMLTRLQASAGNQRFIRFMAWADGEIFKTFGCVERIQLEDDALLLKGMACDGYRKMFPD